MTRTTAHRPAHTEASSRHTAATSSSTPTAAAPSSSLPLPRPSRSASHASAEVYGFCLYVCTFALAALYLCWALLPDDLLRAWGISYYPDKWWALALPAWSCSLLAAVPLLYLCANMHFTLPLEHPNLMHDAWTTQQKQQPRQHSSPPVSAKSAPADSEVSGQQPSGAARQCTGWAASSQRYSIPDMLDLSLEHINEMLYAQQPRG